MSRLATLVSIIAADLVINEEDVKPESKLSEDLGADSLDIAEMVISIEEEYSIQFLDEETESLKTVADILALVEAKAGPE